MKTFVVLVLCLLLAACAAGKPKDYVRCTVSYKRDAGMGIKLDTCHAWQIGYFGHPKLTMSNRPGGSGK